MATVWDALRGGLMTRALALVAELQVAQALRDGPRSAEELAEGSGSDPDVVYRLLRALASDGIFEEVAPRTFRNTKESASLAEPGTEGARLFGGVLLQAVTQVDASGRASFPRAFGVEFWSWLGSHPEERAWFDQAMAQGSEQHLERLDAAGFCGDETIVDVGGGNGSLSGAKWLDLMMLVISAGHERTEDEWRVLLRESSWEPVRFHETGVIEARPCR